MWPRPVDPTGLDGPTRSLARGPGWRRTSPGLYVPATVSDSLVEQRILEEGARLGDVGALTGWAALRWQGAAYFTGLDWVVGEPLDVPLVVGPSRLRPAAGFVQTQEQLAPDEWHEVAGLRCTRPCRAVFDEIRRVATPSIRDAVVAADMAVAALPVTADELRAYVALRGPWTGIERARTVVDLVVDSSRSPQETRLRLVWELDAELPRPLCNVPVYDRWGQLIGVPDLLDPVAGVGAEYDGGDHRRPARRRRDSDREAAFRRHGLELVHVVEGELADRDAVARRLRQAHQRAPYLSTDERTWTLTPYSHAA